MVYTKKYIIQSGEVVSRNINGETLVLVPTCNKLYRLNKVGKVIWENLDGKTTIDEIVSVISRKFEIEKENVQKDVIEFIDELSTRGMIVIRTKPNL